MYQVRISRSAQRELGRLPLSDRSRVAGAITSLARNPRPRGAAKLEGQGLWRIRSGDYRVIYQVRDQELIVLVVRVAHRREAYR